MPDEPNAAATPDAALAELQTRVSRAEGKNAEYEKLLLDPVFLQYLSAKQNGTIQPSSGAPATPTKTIDLDTMSNTELADYILRTAAGMVAQTVYPVQQQTQFAGIKADIEKVAGEHADFWDYKDEMIRLGRIHPTMGAEDAYRLAKSKPGTRKVVSGDVPGGGGSTKTPQPKGFDAAFATALKAAGMKGGQEG